MEPIKDPMAEAVARWISDFHAEQYQGDNERERREDAQ